MTSYHCPNCKASSLSGKEKYRASHWKIIHCDQCDARLCATPILLAVVYMIYFWAFAWFIGWALYEQTWEPLLYLIPVWLILEFLNTRLMPISVMRPKKR